MRSKMRLGFPTEAIKNEPTSWVELIPFNKSGHLRLNCPSTGLDNEGAPQEILSDNPSPHTALKNYRAALSYFNSKNISVGSLEYRMPTDPSRAINDASQFCSTGPSSKLALLLAFAQQSKPANDDYLVLISADFKIHNSSVVIEPLRDISSLVVKWQQTKESGAKALILHSSNAASLIRELNRENSLTEKLDSIPLSRWNISKCSGCQIVAVDTNSICHLAEKLELPKYYFEPFIVRKLWKTTPVFMILFLLFAVVSFFIYQRATICAPFRWDCFWYGHPEFDKREVGIVVDGSNDYGGTSMLPGNSLVKNLSIIVDEIQQGAEPTNVSIVLVDKKNAAANAVGGTGLYIKNGIKTNDNAPDDLLFNHVTVIWKPRNLIGLKSHCDGGKYRTIMPYESVSYNSPRSYDRFPPARIWLPGYARLMSDSPPLFASNIWNSEVDDYASKMVISAKTGYMSGYDNSGHTISKIYPAFYPWANYYQIFTEDSTWQHQEYKAEVKLTDLKAAISSITRFKSMLNSYMEETSKDSNNHNCVMIPIGSGEITNQISYWNSELSVETKSNIERQVVCAALQFLIEQWLLKNTTHVLCSTTETPFCIVGSECNDFSSLQRNVEMISNILDGVVKWQEHEEVSFCRTLTEWLVDLEMIMYPGYSTNIIEKLRNPKCEEISTSYIKNKDVLARYLLAEMRLYNARLKTDNTIQTGECERVKFAYNMIEKNAKEYKYCADVERAKEILLDFRDPMDTKYCSGMNLPTHTPELLDTARKLLSKALILRPRNKYVRFLNSLALFYGEQYSEAKEQLYKLLTETAAGIPTSYDKEFYRLYPCDSISIDTSTSQVLYLYTLSLLYSCKEIDGDALFRLVSSLPLSKIEKIEVVEAVVYSRAMSLPRYTPGGITITFAYGSYLMEPKCEPLIKDNAGIILEVANLIKRAPSEAP